MTAPRPLRVAYLNGSLDIGGAEQQMLALAEKLPRDRFTIEFVVLTHRGTLAPAAEAAGARVRLLGWARRKSRFHVIRWLVDLVRLGPAMRAGHYDIVDAWLFHGYAIAALTRPIARFPVLISGRVRLSDYKSEFNPLERFLDALARRWTDAIVANSEVVRADVAYREHVDLERIRVIRSGIESSPPMSASERDAIRAGYGVGPADLVVGCVANYKPGKGLETLVRVAAALHTRVPALRMVLIGEGRLRPVLEQMIKDMGLEGVVRLNGREPARRVPFGAFDIVAHASVSEGLPIALLEAAIAGRAIVATAAGGTPEIVVAGETGLLVPVGDEDGFARELHKLAVDPALRERLGAAARERAATAFGVDRFVAETAALYEELAERKGVRR